MCECVYGCVCICVGMSTSRRPDFSMHSPGPQAYETEDSWRLNSKKRRGPSFGFGRETRTSSFLYAWQKRKYRGVGFERWPHNDSILDLEQRRTSTSVALFGRSSGTETAEEKNSQSVSPRYWRKKLTGIAPECQELKSEWTVCGKLQTSNKGEAPVAFLAANGDGQNHVVALLIGLIQMSMKAWKIWSMLITEISPKAGEMQCHTFITLSLIKINAWGHCRQCMVFNSAILRNDCYWIGNEHRNHIENSQRFCLFEFKNMVRISKKLVASVFFAFIDVPLRLRQQYVATAKHGKENASV